MTNLKRQQQRRREATRRMVLVALSSGSKEMESPLLICNSSRSNPPTLGPHPVLQLPLRVAVLELKVPPLHLVQHNSSSSSNSHQLLGPLLPLARTQCHRHPSWAPCPLHRFFLLCLPVDLCLIQWVVSVSVCRCLSLKGLHVCNLWVVFSNLGFSVWLRVFSYLRYSYSTVVTIIFYSSNHFSD